MGLYRTKSNQMGLYHQSKPSLMSLLLRALVLITATQGTAVTQSDSASSSSTSSPGVCTVKGRVYTQRNWYGYLVHKAFHRDYAKIQYQITYPVKECCASLLIYYDDQVKQLRSSMTCDQRLQVLPPDNNQVIHLRVTNDSSGCTLWNETGEAFYVCLGERIFRSSVPRTWFFALSHCDREGSLNLNYVFNITGYYGECEDDPLAPSSGWNSYVGFLENGQESSSSEDVYRYLSISLGVVAGVGLISAAVFFSLWFMGLKNAAKGKGSSVTSSQATMTQDDIFYMNPSLSEREQVEYNQSGSENYYEVIPERRSYESISTSLANSGLHMRQLRTPLGAVAHHPHAHHHAHAHPHPHHAHHTHVAQPKDASNLRSVTYMFEDYPPPPYQPPRILGALKNTALGPTSSHSHAISVPANQRPRPTIIHHAYHSSLVPTSAALNSCGVNPGMSSSGEAMICGMNTGLMNLHSGNSLNNNSIAGGSLPNNSIAGGSQPNNSIGIQNFPNNLSTFSGPVGNTVINSGVGANLTSPLGHRLLSAFVPHHSVGSNQPLSSCSPLTSLSASLNSSGPHMSHSPASGQSETSA